MKARILIADDEALARRLIIKALSPDGYECDEASDVSSAMSLLEENEYSIVLTDKNMPDVDGTSEGGVTLVRYIRKHIPGTQVIMITGYPTLETAVDALRHGAFDYIAKPFPKQELCEKVDRIVEYQNCINPEQIIRTHRRLHDHILTLLESTHVSMTDDLRTMLQTVDRDMDHVVASQAESERIMLMQRESMARIAGLTEQLNDELERAGSSPSPLINEIIKEASNRI